MSDFFVTKEDYAFSTLDLLLQLLPPDVGQDGRGRVMSRKHSNARRAIGGAFVHGGVAGVTQFSFQCPNFCKYVNLWAKANMPEDFESCRSGWTSFQVSLNMSAKAHKGSHNQGKNVITAVGNFSGGELWLAEGLPDLGRPCVKKVGRQLIKGVAVDVQNQVFEFSPKVTHATLPWKGSRKTVTFYTIRDSFRLSSQNWQLLEDAHFPVQNMSKPTFFQLRDDDLEGESPATSPDGPRQPVHWPIANMLKHLSSWILRSRSRSSPLARHHVLAAESHRADGRGGVPGSGATSPASKQSF